MWTGDSLEQWVEKAEEQIAAVNSSIAHEVLRRLPNPVARQLAKLLLILGAAVLLFRKIMHPVETWHSFVGSARTAARSSLQFWQGTIGWARCLQSLSSFTPYCAVVALWFGYAAPIQTGVECPPPRIIEDFSLLPLSDHVHFDDAAIGANKELTGEGTQLTARGNEQLRETVAALGRLSKCREETITVRPYGFASDEPFRHLASDDEKNSMLNQEAARLRGEAVQMALAEHIENLGAAAAGIELAEAHSWNTIEEMQNQRDSKADTGPAPVDQRIVWLDLPKGVSRCVEEKRAQPGEDE